MYTDDFFTDVAEKVMERLEVNYYDLTASRERRFVDARAVMVGLLVGGGMSQGEVAGRLGLTRQGVNRLANGLEDRLRWNTLLREVYEDLRNEIAPR